MVETVQEALASTEVSKITAVHLHLGDLAGVVRDALDFCYDLATQGTLLEGSRLIVHELPVVIFCPQCQEEVQLPSIQSFRCPNCGTPSGDIRQGRELEIHSVEVESPA
jgi:hydrogenase nickel incorporation protein HypA/HybF